MIGVRAGVTWRSDGDRTGFVGECLDHTITVGYCGICFLGLSNYSDCTNCNGFYSTGYSHAVALCR
jgi:hypothetical protein